MKIKVNSIILKNFKGVEDSAINFDNASVNIFGANATGKTTHQDAFGWVLFGKDSLNSATFEIKALDTAGTPAHNLEHLVEVFLDVDGAIVSLKKVYAEKWTRKRGLASPEFTGHTTTHFINQVPATKKEYDSKISSLIDESAFRLLADPRYFNEQIHWQKRRDLLLEVCGGVSDQSVIESSKELSSLPEILADRTIEDHKKMIISQRKAVNDELAKIPTRIDEVSKSIVEIPEEKHGIEATVNRLETEKAKLESELTDLRNGGEASKLRIKLQEVIAEINKAENAFDKDQRNRIATQQEKIDSLRKSHGARLKEISDHDTKTSKIKLEKLNLDEQVENLRAEWGEVDAKKFKHTGKCPTCGQDIPADQMDEAQAKFNEGKADKLKTISITGKAMAARIAELKAILIERESTRAGFATARDGILADINKVETFLSSIRKEKADTEELAKKAADIEDEIMAAQNGSKESVDKTLAEIQFKTESITPLKEKLLQIKNNGKAQERIVELSIKEKKLIAEFNRLEGELYLIEQFTRAKVDLLENQINSKFKIARFKLFLDQINGGLTETCETMLDGVPYGSINSAGRVQIGLDIIQTLQAHYGVSTPIWLDNRESVIEIPEIDAQVISLIVSEKDKTLRVESVENPRTESPFKTANKEAA